jgi:hypothetical protein
LSNQDCNGHAAFERKLLCEHRSWLNRFNRQFGKNWEKLLLHDPESAMCEAAVRRLLELNGNDVEPNEILDGAKQSPDFRCTQAGKLFFVEATCISTKKTTELTGLNHFPDRAFHFSGYAPLTDSIYHAVIRKTPQCANLGQPALVAVGTFHWQASNLCFEHRHLELLLTGETSISQKIDTATGGPIGDSYISTELRSATFLSPKQGGYMRHARNPVSGILACGFGFDPPVVRCVVHPQPVHMFDRMLLPKVECCRLRPEYKAGKFSAEWF